MKSKITLIMTVIIILFTTILTTAGSRAIMIKFDGKYIKHELNQVSISNGIPIIDIKVLEEKFRFEYVYDKKFKRVKGKVYGKEILFRIANKYAYINDKKITLQSPPVIINGNIMVPIDLIRKAFSAKVTWDKTNRIINIYSDNIINIHFIDVGKGESIFIDYKDYDILIDCGMKNQGKTIVNYLKNVNTDDIELFITTQSDFEHIGGIKEIMSNFNVNKFIFSGTTIEKEEIRKNIIFMPSKNSVYLIEDKDLTFDLGNGVFFKVLETGDNYKNINNNSVVTMLEHNDVKILFTGDIEKDVELRNLGKFTDVDILKVANNGKITSTCNEFLDLVKPEVAVICSGVHNEDENNEEEINNLSPSKEVINRLNERDIEVFNTKDNGNIVITIDGERYSINTIPINGVFIRQIDFINRSIILYNKSYKHQDLSNCIVTDKTGEKVYYLKEGSIVETGYQRIFELVEASEEEQTKPDEKKEWIFRENFISDKGILYDQNWNKLDEYD